MSEKTVKNVIEELMEVYAVDFKREGVPLPSYVHLVFGTYPEYDDEGEYDDVPIISTIYFFNQNKQKIAVDIIVDEGTKNYKMPLPIEDVIISELENWFYISSLQEEYEGKKIPIYIGE